MPFWLSSVHFSLSSVRAFYLRCIFGYLGCSVSIFGHIFFIFGRLRCSFDVSWGRIVLLSHYTVSLDADLGGKLPEDLASKWYSRQPLEHVVGTAAQELHAG